MIVCMCVLSSVLMWMIVTVLEDSTSCISLYGLGVPVQSVSVCVVCITFRLCDVVSFFFQLLVNGI